MGLDFPFINGLKDQRDEFYYNRIVQQMPQLDNTPELLYGDKELMWLRYINEGVMTFMGQVDFPTYLKNFRGVTRTIYVRATGNDSNDGSSVEKAFREIKAAVDSLNSLGPVRRGKIVIDVGAGTYKGGIRLPLTRGDAQDDFIYIQGPAKTHPSLPTAIIDKAADTSQTYGIRVEDGDAVYLEDIQTLGAFDIHVDVRRNAYVWFDNVVSDGQKVGGVNGVGGTGGLVGWALNTHVRYYVKGGQVKNMVNNGVQELFNCVRSYDSQTSAADALVISNCDVGVQAKEDCSGHLDWTVIQDCGTGVELNGMCVSNIKAITLKRNLLGIALVNSEIHNETGVVWGTGADSNTRDFISIWSPELYTSGWTESATARTMTTGHRPLICVANKLTPVTLVGPTSEADFFNFGVCLKARRHNTAGKAFKVRLKGVVNTTLVGTYRLLLRVGGNFLTDVTLAAGTPANARFEVEFETICTADGANQICFSKLVGEGVTSDLTDPTRTFDMGSADMGVVIRGLATNAADSVSLKFGEVLA